VNFNTYNFSLFISLISLIVLSYVSCWCIQGDIEHLSKVTSVRYVVVDEADRMIEKHHFNELQQLFQLINSEQYVQ